MAMTKKTKARIGLALVLFVALVIILAMSSGGCAAVRKHLYVGGGAAAGAAAGSLVGPAGAAAGGAIGAIAVGATADTQEFRDGDVVGEKALRREMERWRSVAIRAEARAEDRSAWLRWALLTVAAYFVVRNREHLWKFGPGYLRRIWHALVGGKQVG